MQTFRVILIKPSKYDDDGYLISWYRAAIPSNTLACLYSLTEDVRDKRLLGEDVDLILDAYDEGNCRIPIQEIICQVRKSGGKGIICLVGVQSNQFPRAVDLARKFQAAGIQTCIGGFHVSGCLSMLPDLPADLKEAMSNGITLYAGEIEGRWEHFLKAAYAGKLNPLYNFLNDLPSLEGYPAPILPRYLVRKYTGAITSFDAGRGCPFECSFCTIINVQGRKSRGRTPDDVERIIRGNYAQGIKSYFITDDDFARHRGWEAILDRVIKLREEEGLKVSFTIQVDTACSRLNRFIEKAARAGCSKVFLGLENINQESLMGTGKKQNHVGEYRAMLQAWRNHGVITYAGYIIGFPIDTYESVMRDIETIKQELPIDLLEFFFLTPLPGSEDHQKLDAQGAWMDPDMNNYDTEHVTTHHPRMSKEEWEQTYREAWKSYYSPEHIETLFRRAGASGLPMGKILGQIFSFYGSIHYEGVHPLQSGAFRRMDRTSRRPGFPIENPLIFYPRYAWKMISTAYAAARLALRLQRVRRRVERSPNLHAYTDQALEPVLLRKIPAPDSNKTPIPEDTPLLQIGSDGRK